MTFSHEGALCPGAPQASDTKMQMMLADNKIPDFE